ncbi:hypothetical protein EIP86_008099 [Pleurotus ostreatoroseus]|nr:hypothetical protein EIP86_008099 [Pleurotus ostreatoroseus]
MHSDPFDADISSLCKNQETQKLAKDYFKLIRSLRPGEGISNLPPGVVSICAFIAHVRMGHKRPASVKPFQKVSLTTPKAFLDSLSSIQDMLMKAEETVKSVKFKDARALSCNYNFQPLPLSDSPCQNCLKKQHHCLKASWKSKKGPRCVACNLRQLTCSVEDKSTAGTFD